MILRLAASLLALALCGGASAQPVVPDAASMARAALGTEVGSASVALWRDGQLTHADVRRLPGAGAAPAPALADAAAPPLYEIGSISKVFTGLLLAQAVEKGDLTLDDTLGKLLRGKLTFVSDKVAAITLRQLVTHSACLPRQFGALRDGRAIVTQIRKTDHIELLMALEQQQLGEAAPCPARYSNYGLAVLGVLLAEHYGKRWDDLVLQNIAAPVGMRDTLVHLGAQSDRLVAAFSGEQVAAPWLMNAFAGAGGLRSSVQDLVLFGRAILAGRKGPLGAAAERLLTPLGLYQGRAIGYAVFIHGPPARRTYSHDGLTGGFRALLTLTDSGEVMAAMVSNAQAPLPQMAQAWWAARYPVPARPIALEPGAMLPLAGVYQAEPELRLSVTVHDRSLYMRSNGNVFRPYVAVAPDTFTRPAGGALVRFEQGPQGVSALVFEQAGNRIVATRSAEAAPVDVILAPGKADPYIGRYVVSGGSGAGIAFDVRAESGQLSVRSTRYPWEPVFPLAGRPDRFRYDLPNAELQFERDADGRVVALVLHQRGELRAGKLAQ